MNELKSANPDIIAHRGASACAPENTMAAFDKAMQAGADWIELDVQLSGDGVAVVLHDASVDRTTNGRGFLTDFTLAELRQLDAGSYFSPAFSNERIPTLNEVLEQLAPNIRLDIEIKSSVGGLDTLATVLQILEDTGQGRNCAVTSFDLEIVRACKMQEPDLSCGLIFDEMPEYLFDEHMDIWAIEHHLLSDALMERARASGRTVFVWTAHHDADVRRMLELGVDGIICDDPARVREIISQKSKE
ncbi:glycerophosphodiester phosphodiesterase [candidate division KSB1 bacterium]|nr:glycerophosphodiester phosphodiesterase [candidate division KSB1 bacterium]